MSEDAATILNEPLHVGSGVEHVLNDLPKESEAQKKKDLVVTDDNGVTYILNTAGVCKFSSKPTFKGQYGNPKLWQAGPLVAKVFHSNVAEEFDAYNVLLKRSSTSEDPEVVICSNEVQFWKGNFVVLVTYREIFYSVLINKQ